MSHLNFRAKRKFKVSRSIHLRTFFHHFIDVFDLNALLPNHIRCTSRFIRKLQFCKMRLLRDFLTLHCGCLTIEKNDERGKRAVVCSQHIDFLIASAVD